MLTTNQKKLLEETNLPLFLLLEAQEINSDDEPDQSKDDEPASDSESDAVDDSAEEAPSQEEIFQAEMEGSEDKFLQYVLYDKLVDLNAKLSILLDNIKNDPNTESIELVSKLEHYVQYLNVLNELIFTVSTVVIYRILGQIEIEVINLLEVYNSILEEKKQDKGKENGIKNNQW